METQQGMKRWQFIVLALILALSSFAAFGWETRRLMRAPEHWTITLDTTDQKIDIRGTNGKWLADIDFKEESEITVTIKRRGK